MRILRRIPKLKVQELKDINRIKQTFLKQFFGICRRRILWEFAVCCFYMFKTTLKTKFASHESKECNHVLLDTRIQFSVLILNYTDNGHAGSGYYIYVSF